MKAMKVKLKGWRSGLQKVSVAKTLREQTGLGLAESKHVVDDLLDGEQISLDVDLDFEATNKLIIMLRSMGVICEIED